MKLFILKLIETKRSGPGYDEMLSVAIRAENETRARELAAGVSEAEGRETWLNPEYSTCEPLEQGGNEEIIIRDVAWA